MQTKKKGAALSSVENVVILPDHDAQGRTHAEEVARTCHAAGLKVKIVLLPNLPAKGDVSGWLDAGHTRDELAGLVTSARLHVPPTTATIRVELTPAPSGSAL